MAQQAFWSWAGFQTESDIEERRPPRAPSSAWRWPSAATAALAAVLASCAALAALRRPSLSLGSAGGPVPRKLSDDQHFWIVRHGDKYSSYPDCTDSDKQKTGTPCFDKGLMGDNPPLTTCGVKQAKFTAEWLQHEATGVGGIGSIAVSPYTRTLQTALPLAQALNKSLKVEYLLSEANQPEGPHREFNILETNETVAQLRAAGELWDLGYGSPPIPTPETPPLYGQRVKKAAKVLRTRFPAAKGNVAIFTHATTSFSVAYGLCHGEDGDDQTLQSFVERQAPIGPAGVIHVVLGGDGKCKTIHQTANVAEEVDCGKTEPFKCNFDDFPAWYWPHNKGKGPGNCH